MVNELNSASLASRRDRQIQLGLVLTALWLGAGVLYVALSMGWTAFLRLPLGDLGDFLDGAFAPLAFLWLVLGLFLQQRELAANNVAIQRQFEIMQRTAEHAEIQTRAIAANELHARQDTFIDVAQLVMNQLEVIAGMLYISSQGTIGDGVVSDEEIDLMFTRLSSGEATVFSRRMILLHVRVAEHETAGSFSTARRSARSTAKTTSGVSSGCCAAPRHAIPKHDRGRDARQCTGPAVPGLVRIARFAVSRSASRRLIRLRQRSKSRVTLVERLQRRANLRRKRHRSARGAIDIHVHETADRRGFDFLVAEQPDLVNHARVAELLFEREPGVDRVREGQLADELAAGLRHDADGRQLAHVATTRFDQVAVHGGVEVRVVHDVIDVAVLVVVHLVSGYRPQDGKLVAARGRRPLGRCGCGHAVLLQRRAGLSAHALLQWSSAAHMGDRLSHENQGCLNPREPGRPGPYAQSRPLVIEEFDLASPGLGARRSSACGRPGFATPTFR